MHSMFRLPGRDAAMSDEYLFWCQDCQRAFASHRGLSSHRGRVHNDKPSRTCPTCGAIVGDRALHEKYHQNQQRVATQAAHADLFTRPLGGTQR